MNFGFFLGGSAEERGIVGDEIAELVLLVLGEMHAVLVRKEVENQVHRLDDDLDIIEVEREMKYPIDGPEIMREVVL